MSESYWDPSPSELDAATHYFPAHITITAEMESFFVAIALLHGTSPKPVFGYERLQLAQELAELIEKHPGKPAVFGVLQRGYAEMGGQRYSVEWFWDKMASAYLSWVYSQAASQGLLEQALEEAANTVRSTASDQYKLRHIKLWLNGQ